MDGFQYSIDFISISLLSVLSNLELSFLELDRFSMDFSILMTNLISLSYNISINVIEQEGYWRILPPNN